MERSQRQFMFRFIAAKRETGRKGFCEHKGISAGRKGFLEAKNMFDYSYLLKAIASFKST